MPREISLGNIYCDILVNKGIIFSGYVNKWIRGIWEENMKKIVFILTVVLIFLSSLVYGEDYIEPSDEKAIVIEASEPENREDLYQDIMVQMVTIEITSGKYKGDIREIENHLPDNAAYSILVEKGDKVIVMIEDYEDWYQVYISDYQRSDYIVYLLVLGVILVLVIGRIKGLKSILSLGLTISAVIYILLPQILKGANPIPVSIMISIGVTVITIFLVGGINSKGVSAILGTISGVIIAGAISYIVGNQAHLTGLSAEEATMLIYIPQQIEFNFKNLLFSGIILGSLGAVMDVGMSISSSIEEIYKANNALSIRELFNSGMNVGRDIMGTMINTLILAYTGTSIPMLLLFMAHETSMTKIINLDIIATEVVRSLSGSIGLILTIPITAFISSLLIKKQSQDKEGVDLND